MTLVESLLTLQPASVDALRVSTYFSARICSPEVLLKFTQSSTLKSFAPKFREGSSGTFTNALVPLKLNDWSEPPATPGPKVAPPCKVLLLFPTASLGLPSALYQLTVPASAPLPLMLTPPAALPEMVLPVTVLTE